MSSSSMADLKRMSYRRASNLGTAFPWGSATQFSTPCRQRSPDSALARGPLSQACCWLLCGSQKHGLGQAL